MSYLTQPLVIVCLLLVASVVIKNTRWKKWLFHSGLGLLLFFSNDFIANEMITWWEVKPTPFTAIRKQYDYGILLTGVTKSEMEPKDRVYFSRGADRVTHSMQLYKLGIIKKILVSGGSGRLITIKEREADEVAKALLLMGVPQIDIEIENQSKNTRESAIAVKKILNGKILPENCLLITSGYHLRRSAACFRKVGLPMDLFATDFLSHKRTYTLDVLIIPKVDGLNTWSALIKEWVGFTAYWISGYV
ncbi:MAG: YdcF family protein [Bacteroidota bacterium]